jgi:hypothetical protein
MRECSISAMSTLSSKNDRGRFHSAMPDENDVGDSADDDDIAHDARRCYSAARQFPASAEFQLIYLASE